MSLESGKMAEYRAMHMANCACARCQQSRLCMETHGTYSSDKNEHWFVDELSLSEQAQSEVNEDEILAQLRENAEQVFCCSLGSV